MVHEELGKWVKMAIGLPAGIHKAKWYNLENKTYY